MNHLNRSHIDDYSLPIKPIYTRVPRFEPGSIESKKYLQKYGYVVIKNVLSQQESNTAINLIWDYLENLNTGINRHNYHTWNNDKWPPVVQGGILTSHGIGQSNVQWFIREKKRVINSFARIWDTNNLLTSFDGIGIFRPWKLNYQWKIPQYDSPLYINQHPIHRPGLQCVQGLVNLLPMDESSGGLVLIPKSHLDFPNLITKYPNRISNIPLNTDYFKYPQNDPLLINNKNKPIMCHLEVGDMLLWDARTIHNSSSGLVEPSPNTQIMRAISLISMFPRHLVPIDVTELRKQSPYSLNSTTNWCDRFVSFYDNPIIKIHQDFNKYPDTNGYPFTPPKPPILNKTQLQLIGFTEHEINTNVYPYTCFKSKL